MDRRLPARVLALLALVGVSVALFVVVTSGGEGSGDGARPEAAPTTASKASTKNSRAERRRSRRRSYTVKPGDTPSGIAEKTGVSVTRMLELNPDLDPQSLQAGTKLKLR